MTIQTPAMRKNNSIKALERYSNSDFIEKMRKIHQCPIRNRKISEARKKWFRDNKGTDVYENWRKKISVTVKKWSDAHPDHHYNKFCASNNKRTFIEKIMFNNLNENNIRFEEQKRIGKYFPDFVINNNLIVECDGEHWHTDKIYEKKRDKYLESQGYKIIHFLGNEIIKDIDNCIKIIKLQIEQLSV